MVEDGSIGPAGTMVVVEQSGGKDRSKPKRLSKQGTIVHFLANSHNIGMGNGGGFEKDDGENDVMPMDPRIGNGKTTTTRRLRSSVQLRKKKIGGGTRSKTRKGLAKEWGGSDSSQPGIRKFLLENDEKTRSFKISSNNKTL